MEDQIRAILRHMEGQEKIDSHPHQGKLQNIWPFAHIPMYTGLRVISTCIREKGFKSRVWIITGAFRDDLGNIKGKKIVHRVQRVCRGIGKAINVWSTMCGKISCNILTIKYGFDSYDFVGIYLVGMSTKCGFVSSFVHSFWASCQNSHELTVQS